MEQAEEVYDLGGVTLSIEAAYLVKRDCDEIYCRLKRKIKSGQRLMEEELMELMVLPLMVKGKNEKQKVIRVAVELAKELTDRSEQISVLAGILTFTDKVIDREYAQKVKEEMQMTLVGQMLIEEGQRKGQKEGLEKGLKKGKTEGEYVKLISQIRKKAAKNISAEASADMLEEELPLVTLIYDTVKSNPDWDDTAVYQKISTER